MQPNDVLRLCAEIQKKKSEDYQNQNSSVKQADYYPRGLSSIMDMINTKTLRMWSLLQNLEQDPKASSLNESLEDSAIDLINYATFFVAYCNYNIDGQDKSNDLFNRPKQ